MKNKDIYNLYQGLYEISQDKELKFDIQTSFILAKNKSLLKPLYDAIIDTRQKALESYGEQLENGDWRVPKERIEEFSKEWLKFMDMDNFIILQKIKLEDIKNKEINIDLMEKLLLIIDN